MFKNIEAVLIDLDGTLVDSVPDLAAAVDAMLAQLGYPPRGEDNVRRWVGNGTENLIRRAIHGGLEGSEEGRVPDDLVARAWPIYKAAYLDNICVHSRLYPGVRESLEALQGLDLRLACVTNKLSEFARPLLADIGIGDYFQAVVGGEDIAHHKPAPDALLVAARRLGVPIHRCLMVGDSFNDVGAARNAGCPVVCVPYGYNYGQDIREANPDAVIDSLAQLRDLLQAT